MVQNSDKLQEALAYSKWKYNNHKECFVKPLEIKELDNGDLIVKGYIATTHVDSGFMDEERNVYVRDHISKETLEKWAQDINLGNPRTNKVSVNHNRMPHVAGVGIKGTARVDRLDDGNYGLYVETLVDKTREDFSEIKYRIDHGLLDSYSIEFTTKDAATNTYKKGAVQEKVTNEGILRTLLPQTQLEGWTLASQPMNEYAVMVKEFYNYKEAHSMAPEEKKKADYAGEETDDEEDVEESSPKKPAKKGVQPAQMNESSGVAPVPSNPWSKFPQAGKELDMEAYQLGLEMKEKARKEKDIAEMKTAVVSSVIAELKEKKVENKVVVDNPETVEKKELVEYREMLKNSSKVSLKEQFRIAARVAEAKGLINSNGVKPTINPSMAAKSFGTNGTQLEFKGLGLTTNQNTDTDYLLSAAELADSFDPVIYNALNQQTVFWNILNKDDYSNKGNNLVQFTLKTAANSTAAAYTGNAVTTGSVTRLKYETRFKKYQVGVEVDGDMIAAARGGPIGDVFAQEVMDSTIDLLSKMNSDLFGTSGAETDAAVIGLKYLADSSTYTSLYNLTRSSANKLAPSSAANTYINASSARISPDLIRQAVEQAIVDGSMMQNLVLVTHPRQVRLFKNIYDGMQRPVPTSSRFGFEGRPELDGVPIFEDKDCANSDWYLVDLDTMRVAIWVPPTLEMLGKDADSQKGFIKTYWCTYCRAPRRLINIYGCATS